MAYYQSVGYELLSIVIPVYNEERTVEILLEKVLKAKLPIKREVVIIDDGSADSSPKIIGKVISRHPGQQIRYYRKANGGKGSAVRMGFEKAKGDIFLIQDADLEYDPSDYRSLINPILKGKSQVVYGSRYLSERGHLKENSHLTFKIHKLGNDFLSLLASMLYGQRFTDIETGYKLFTSKVYSRLRLESDDFRIEPEITSQILKLGYRITEVPINYYSRDFNEGKKITWRDGVKAAGLLVWLRLKK
jgi:dolichol-phosphate mannosyltransferase